MDKPKNPLKEIEDNLSRIDSRIEFLKKENELLDKVATELRKITSSTTNDLYSISNDMLYNKKLNNNTLINKLSEEKLSKEQSIAKLASLFEQLSSVNNIAKEGVDEEGLPLMDIREELDEDGNVISATVKLHHLDTILNGSQALAEPSEKPKDPLLFNNKNEEGLPFMDIKEEVDENGNSIRGSVLPQVGGDGIESKYSSDDQIDNNQILELFEDMGITERNEKGKELSHPEEQQKGLTDFEKNLKSKLLKKSVPKKSTPPVNEVAQHNVETLNPENAIPPSIPEEEILQLELIADEIAENDEPDGENINHIFADDEDWEFEEDEEEEEDDDYDFEPVQNEVNSLLMDRINSLRAKSETNSKSSENSEAEIPEVSGIQKSILKSHNSSKVKKSVKFNSDNLEQVKEIENVSEELKKINNNNLKTSLFKQARVSHSEKIAERFATEKEEESEKEEIISETIKERLVVEHPSEMPKLSSVKESKFKKQLYPGLMTPVKTSMKTPEPEKKQSKFKQEILNNHLFSKNAGNKEKIIEEVVNTERRFKKNLDSLNPKVKARPATAIRIPVVDIKESDTKENELFEKNQDRKVQTEEDTTKIEPPLEKDDKVEVLETTLDYQTLQDDMDGMAKAYILGLYDDDIATEGEVIEKLEDFEKINKIIEMREAQKPKKSTNSVSKKRSPKNQGNQENENHLDNDLEYYEDDLDVIESEIDEDEDSKILSDQIVEREIALEEAEEPEMDSIDAPLYLNDDNDLSLTQNVLNQQVNLQYNTLRNKLILNQNHFKKSDEESEFEPIDEEGNPIKMSRFKAARLVHKKDL